MMSAAGSVSPISVLLVEDDPGDVALTRKSMKASKLSNELHVVDDGVAALAFLRREPPYADAGRPDLILLDLNLPRKDGREVLAEVKADRELATIPVVILTTSAAEKDIAQSYDLHANAYVQKPVDVYQFMHVIKSIDEFFVSIVRLPSR
jgi:CheY-like chemotaxis protein